MKEIQQLMAGRAIAYALRGMRNPVKRVFGVFWWRYTPTKTPHFLSSVLGNRPNAIALWLVGSRNGTGVFALRFQKKL